VLNLLLFDGFQLFIADVILPLLFLMLGAVGAWWLQGFSTQITLLGIMIIPVLSLLLGVVAFAGAQHCFVRRGPPGDDEDQPADGTAVDGAARPPQELFILCRSQDRINKDLAIVRRFEQRIEERLRAMAARCQKQKRDVQKVEREVGRMLGQNTRAAKLFEVTVQQREDGGAQLNWKKIEGVRDWAAVSAGCYLLRTNVLDWTDEELWNTYMQLTEAEAAFRIQKSDLSIRPIWHQKEERVLAHILVCFLAYVLWKTLEQMCRHAGLGDEPRRVFDELAEVRLVDVVLPTRDGIEIRQQCVTRPTDHQQILLERLRLRLPSRLQSSGPVQ
jgi:hypothetical protein